jgi:hypothetical protein
MIAYYFLENDRDIIYCIVCGSNHERFFFFFFYYYYLRNQSLGIASAYTVTFRYVAESINLARRK